MTISTSFKDVFELHQDDVEPRGTEWGPETRSDDPVGAAFRFWRKGFSDAESSVLPIVYSACLNTGVLANNGAASLADKLGMWTGVASMTPGLSHSFKGALFFGPKQGVPRLFSLEAANQRLAEIQALTMPSLFSADDDDEDEQLPLTEAALSRAKKLFQTLDSLPPIRHIGIFPMPNGGIHLQHSGADSSISIEIPPDDEEPVLVEFASEDTYWSRRFHSLVETTLMLVRHLR